MTRLPFDAMAHGYTRAEMLGFVLHDLGTIERRLRPYATPDRYPGWRERGRYAAIRRAACRFVREQIAAHERAQEVTA
jgi:hypothetical protein